MCAIGRYEMPRSTTPAGIRVNVAVSSASICACVISTPFGGPVVPEV
jgi:hypothetical protein